MGKSIGPTNLLDVGITTAAISLQGKLVELDGLWEGEEGSMSLSRIIMICPD